ncbi:MAG TPA: EAL domain-containing protein [Rubrivivax sp.]
MPPPTPLLSPSTPPHRRLRAAMGVVLTVVGAVAAVQAWHSGLSEQVREADAEVIALAGSQRALSQRLARQAALATQDGVETRLEEELQRTQDEALKLEDLLKAQRALGPQQGLALSAALEQWQAKRERLWYRTQILLSKLESSDDAAILNAMALVQAEADPATEAAEALVQQLQRAAQQRSKAAAETVQASMAAMLLALGLVALLVVEPAARAVRRQHERLAAQTVDLERLAMVAERTGNVVIVGDTQWRIVWANAAFERVTGYTLAEAMGHSPRELLHSDRTEPSVVARMTEAFESRRPIRLEVVNRTKDGHEFWVDLDAQPVHDAHGNLKGFVSVRTVITEQVRQRQQMQALLAGLPTGVVLQDAAGRVVECNPAAERALQRSRAELLGHGLAGASWKPLRADLSEYAADDDPAARTLATGLALSGESMAVRTGAGDLRWLLVNTQPFSGAAGDGVISCFVDVTEQRRQQQLLELTIEGSGVGAWQWDIRSGAMHCNDRMATMMGYAPGDVAMSLEAWVDRVHPDDRERWFAAVQAHLDDATVPYRFELRARRPDGSYTPLMSTGAVVERSERGTPRRMAGIHIDLTDQMRMQEVLRHSARTDALTQLPNRTVVLERVRSALARWNAGAGSPFAVLFMDFDRFKQVNDTLGHSAGDELLRQIAQRLQGALRSGDAVGRSAGEGSTAARIGGDEFVIVLEQIRDADDACRVADRLLELLARPYMIANNTVYSSASIGIVASEHAADDPDTVLRDADTAMYEAKRAGRGRWVLFDTAMHERIARQVGLERDLRLGLERGELFVVYQPVVDLGTGLTCGVEALARWMHPVRGLVPPVEFIPVAEESGLIGAVGDFVLEAACAQFVQWQSMFDHDARPVLAVNLSRAQLRLPSLVARVRATLQRTGLEPHCLQLEVTESLAAQDEQVQATLRELKETGVKLALDDFGTGYSSLACLHLLPVDTVKIDRSFVRDAESSEYHRVLIEATIRVAQALGMVVVAEGIETPGQALLLHALRCDKGQGYLYGKPMAPAELLQTLNPAEIQAAA